MDIYNYHPITGEYLYQSMADADPLEPGKYLLPAFSTDTKPPKTNSQEIAVFDSGKWVKKSDYRKTCYWLPDGSEHRIDEIGATIPDGALLEAPSKPVEQLRIDKLIEINAAYETRAQQVTVDVPPSEVQSWPKQEDEARTLKSDPTASVIVLSALAEQRGIPLDSLVDKVIEKANAYSVYIGQITGIRQRLESELLSIDLAAANAAAQIEAIKWPE